MKLKKIAAFLIAVCISLQLCGCGFIGNNEELVAPPELTGDMAPIANALYEAVGENINLEYPAEGERRAAIVLEDIYGDGKPIAFAFYSTSDDELTTMHINAICQNGDEWKSVSDITVVATGVERVEFADLNGNGTKEILVGWDVNGISEKQLNVFAFDKKLLTQQLIQAYTGFLCCDLDDNGTNELFVHLLNTSDKTNKAIVYSYGEEGMVQTAGCQMDTTVKSASAPVLSTLTNGKKAVYIDEIKGVGAVTEVLFLLKGVLQNPLLDKQSLIENTVTLRAASLATTDINSDGTLEIPIASDLPNAILDGEKLFYTNWCSFNGEKLTAKQITVVNTVDGYYFTVPHSMVGKIAVLKDIEKHKREFYYYDAQTQATGDLLFTVTAMPSYTWDSREFNRGGFTELGRKDNTVFAVDVTASAKALEVDNEMIKATFNIIE